MMQDQIFIRHLRLRTIIGLNDCERDKKQDLILNITLFTDDKKVGASDEVDHTTNYKDITKHIIQLTEHSSYFLLEKLAEHIAMDIIQIFHVAKVVVAIDKPHALRFADSVAIEIERSQDDYT